MYPISCALFVIATSVTAWYSAAAVGSGIWGILMLAAAFIVALSVFYAPLRLFAKGIAGAMSVISGLAIALGLLAGTIGGSFNMSREAGSLLICFGVLFVFGIVLVKTSHNQSET